jgi:hypothetical protein
MNETVLRTRHGKGKWKVLTFPCQGSETGTTFVGPEHSENEKLSGLLLGLIMMSP